MRERLLGIVWYAQPFRPSSGSREVRLLDSCLNARQSVMGAAYAAVKNKPIVSCMSAAHHLVAIELLSCRSAVPWHFGAVSRHRLATMEFSGRLFG